MLGNVGGIIALIGVIVLPITSGDTALRALRMSVADALHLDQKSVVKRVGLAAIIFALVAVILVFAKSNADGFNILWRYFAWSNQTLAMFTLWAATVWLARRGRSYVITLLPALFMTVVCTSYLLFAPEGFGLPQTISVAVGVVVALGLLVVFARKRRGLAPTPEN